MSLDNVNGNKTTYVKGKPVLVKHEQKSEVSTTGKVLVSDETTVTSNETKHDKEMIFFPKKETAINAEGEISYDKDMTDEQIENLQKLKKAQDFMKTDEGKKLAESMLNQQIDISKGQKKWLKKQGIDPDAFVQEWNRLNPDSPNNKKFEKAKAESSRDTMAAYAKGFLNDQDMKANKPSQEPIKGVKGLFKKKEQEKVKKDTTYSDTGMKIKHHSSTDSARVSDISDDVTDEIARAGESFLEAFEANDEGKRIAKFKEIDENGNETKYRVRYNKDGSVKKVRVKSDSSGKLKVKQAKDGDITVKGDLQAKYAYADSDPIINIKEKNVKQYEEVKTITNTTEDVYLQRDLKTVDRTKVRVIKPDCPEPDTSYLNLRGSMVSDQPRHGKNFKTGGAVDAQRVIADAEQLGMENLVKGYCGNKYNAKYKASSENGNLNQLNAKFITGCFINAEQTIEKGPNGKDMNGMKADYEKLSSFITEAFQRDQEIISVAGPKAQNLILPYIAKEINEHNAAVRQRSGKHLPGTNNELINKEQLPQFFRGYIK